MTQKVIKIGTSLAVTIPNEIVKKFSIQQGMAVHTAVDDRTKSISYMLDKGDTTVSERANHIASLALEFINAYRDDLTALADK